MSQTISKPTRTPRPLTPTELFGYQQELDRLAVEFTECAQRLRTTPDSDLMIPEMRSAMSRAGLVLTRLLHHRAIAAPSRLPPWLAIRTSGGPPRPRFCAMYGAVKKGWSPKRTVLGLVEALRTIPQVLDAQVPRRPDEDTGAKFIRRHIFIEATAGWLGQLCTPRLAVSVPTIQAVLGIERPVYLHEETRIPMVCDWVRDPTQEHLLFLDLGRDCAAACRYLAALLGERLASGIHGRKEPPLGQWPSMLSTYFALDDLRNGISHQSSAAVLEAHELLFGLRNLHGELAAVADRLAELRQLFPGVGAPHVIADFAVTSGHEALSVLAGRVAKNTGVRRSTIERLRAELDAAVLANDPPRMAKKEYELGEAAREFAKATEQAFTGWDDHHAWIRRSIESESRSNATPTSGRDARFLEPTRNPTARDVLVHLHEAAKVLTDRLRTLVALIHQCREVGMGLLLLDSHLQLPNSEDPDPGQPERAAEYRAAIGELKIELDKAIGAWASIAAYQDRSLQRTLTASGKGATCGPITCTSYHELVIVLSRGILEPKSLAIFETGPLPTEGGVARLRGVRALTEGDPWREIIDSLDREFEKAIELLPHQASTGRLLVAEVRGERERENQAASAGGVVPEAFESLPGHWVPASSLVVAADPRFRTVAKITAFCVRFGIPHRPGLTKVGKPWPRRRDVHLECWGAKVAALDTEAKLLKDAADRMTAGTKRFEEWRREDEAK